jgi:hypothetical protein
LICTTLTPDIIFRGGVKTRNLIGDMHAGPGIEGLCRQLITILPNESFRIDCSIRQHEMSPPSFIMCSGLLWIENRRSLFGLRWYIEWRFQQKWRARKRRNVRTISYANMYHYERETGVAVRNGSTKGWFYWITRDVSPHISSDCCCQVSVTRL